jgi:hypothetical protein
MEAWPIINQSGKLIGDDGVNVGNPKLYVVKDGVKQSTVKDQLQSGNLDYKNLVAIEGDKGTRQTMMNIAKLDSKDNSVEHGAMKDNNGNYIEVKGMKGQVDYKTAKNPADQGALAGANTTNDEMHTHTSETQSEVYNTSNGSEKIAVNKWIQHPSTSADLPDPGNDYAQLKNGQTGYVFGMGMSTNPNGVNPATSGGQTVYIYQKDAAGVISTAKVPLDRFIEYKK